MYLKNHQRIESFWNCRKWITLHILTLIEMFSGNLLIFLQELYFSVIEQLHETQKGSERSRYMCWNEKVKVLLVIPLNSVLLRVLVITPKLCDYVTTEIIKSLRPKASYHQILKDTIFYCFCLKCGSSYYNNHLRAI